MLLANKETEDMSKKNENKKSADERKTSENKDNLKEPFVFFARQIAWNFTHNHIRQR